MKTIAEIPLTDGSVASVRQILTSDWLAVLSGKMGDNTDAALVRLLVTVDGVELDEADILDMPLQDYMLISKRIKQEFESLAEILKES